VSQSQSKIINNQNICFLKKFACNREFQGIMHVQASEEINTLATLQKERTDYENWPISQEQLGPKYFSTWYLGF
jgi:hypothetical protein